MKVRFKSKVTRGFSHLAASRLVFTASHLFRGSRKTSGTRVAISVFRVKFTSWAMNFSKEESEVNDLIKQ